MTNSTFTSGGGPDLLFREDGSVKLPMLTGLCISWARETGGCLSRQPTKRRAEAVAAALRDEYGVETAVRPGRVSLNNGPHVPSLFKSWGVYLAVVTPSAEQETQP